jgi:hypothetical protein
MYRENTIIFLTNIQSGGSILLQYKKDDINISFKLHNSENNKLKIYTYASTITMK